MAEEDYAARHVRFVSDHTGTTLWEIQLVTLIGPTALLLRNLAVPWLFPSRDFANGSTFEKIEKLLIDYSITIVPILLSITIFSDRLRFLTAVLLLCCVVFVCFAYYEYFFLRRVRPPWSSIAASFVPVNRKPIFLTYFRAHVFIATILGILAVDFPTFPRRFAKAETYGFGLMDVGVGLFVIANAMVVNSDRGRPKSKVVISNLYGCIPLVILGFVRLAVVTLAGYHQHVTEYGVHWNFFFTLASIKIFTSPIIVFLPNRSFFLLLSIIFAVGYEYALQCCGWRRMILYGSGTVDNRENLFDANREGIMSIPGYLALYFAGVYMGKHLIKPRRQLKDYGILLAGLINACFILCVMVLASNIYLAPPSRRMVNLTYILWMIFLSVYQITLFVAVEAIVWFGAAANFPTFSPANGTKEPFELFEPCLWKSVNRSALLYFLLGNVATGLINLRFRTLDADDMQCVVILLIYSFAVSAFVYVKNVKIMSRKELKVE